MSQPNFEFSSDVQNKLNQLRALKIAIVHDYLREYGGAERVLQQLHQLFPQAPVYVAFADPSSLGQHWPKFADWKIGQTLISRIPGYRQLFSPLRILAPSAFSQLDLSEFDLVISSANAYFAKAVKVPNGIHVCYCHTPPRALYGYTTLSDWKKNKVIGVLGSVLNHFLRMVDFDVAQKVDFFIANSAETASRITKFYRRQSKVIFPPVQSATEILGVDKFNQLRTEKTENPTDFYLFVNRLALAKHPELAVAACLKLKRKLVVAGVGPMQSQLRSMVKDAGAEHLVTFLGAVDDRQLFELYATATALIYPVEDEDFGMIPVEALSAGLPVIAHNSGGPKETIKAGLNGVLFSDLTESGLVAALQSFNPRKFKSDIIQRTASEFSAQKFSQNLVTYLAELMRHKQ